MNQSSKIKRNIAIYIIGVLSLSAIGGVVTANGHEIGGVILARQKSTRQCKKNKKQY